MQRTITILALAFAGSTSAFAQGCLPGGLVLTTQAQVNSFPQDHPGCTTLEGYLQIGPGAINSLDDIHSTNFMMNYRISTRHPIMLSAGNIRREGLQAFTETRGTVGYRMRF